ncbi:MAG: hypothetical protein J5543_02955 [Bacteroidales bacterium]|nr:hypothetical protein [Bacteroidales bacterium]
MNEDKYFEELFSNYKPTLNDSDAFMQTLQRRLDAVEYVRLQQAEQQKRYRRYILIALIVGMVLGGLLIAFVMTFSQPAALLSFSIQSNVIELIQQNVHFIALIFVLLLLGVSVVVIFHSMQEVDYYLSMRRKEKLAERP